MLENKELILKTRSERTQEKVAQYLTEGPCPECKGARLNKTVLSCKINSYNIADLTGMEIPELIEALKEIKDPVAKPMVKTLLERLQHLVDIGLEYLSLSRETDTLSGGESQRVKIVKHLGSSLTDVIYIFDEPSVGLHPRDIHRMMVAINVSPIQPPYIFVNISTTFGSKCLPASDLI